jgi:kumamolisin
MSQQTHVKIPGSERARSLGGTPGDSVASDAPIRVSVLVRRTLVTIVEAPLIDQDRPPIVSREEFRRRFGADPTDMDRVSRVLTKLGLKLLESDSARRILVFNGTASAAAEAFNVDLVQYTLRGKPFRGFEGGVHIPAELEGLVEGVFGLDERPQNEPRLRRFTEAGGRTTQPRNAKALSPIDVATAYYFPPNAIGTGQTIGIVEFGGGFLDTDTTAFFSGLDVNVPTVTAVSVDAAPNDPGIDTDADGEVALDIQVAGGCAPGAAIVVYFAPNTDAGAIDAYTTAIHDTTNNPSVISISWGNSEDLWTAMTRTAIEQSFSDAAALGVTICVASGDHGASGLVSPDELAHVDFPASAPHALGCGGTHLEVGQSAATESVWNEGSGWASGGGISDMFSVPFYQVGITMPAGVNPGAGTGRGVPDVAGNADLATGYEVIVAGKKETIGGTSAVAPMWAGLIARMNEALGGPIGFINPRLYPLLGSSAFTDIQTGNNNVGHDNGGYSAGAGWDCCTGLGTPVGTALLAALTRSKLLQFLGPNQITCGYSQPGSLWLDTPDTVAVDIHLANDDPNVVTVTPIPATISPRQTSATVIFSAPPIRGPFLPKSTKVHASYRRTTLTVTAEVVPPQVVSLVLSPDTVAAGESTNAIISLNLASLAGDVVIELFCGAPGFATVPTTVTVAQGATSKDSTITTPAIQIPFSPARASILAIYRSSASDPGTSATAMLTVEPTVVAGIIKSLTLNPSAVTGGHTSRGTVTLEQVVPTPTLVGVAALDPLALGGSRLPVPGNASTVAFVPASITIPAGQTTGQFTITTQTVLRGTNRQATIMAGAVLTKSVTLTITP